MAAFEDDFTAFLQADAAITAVVGGRISPDFGQAASVPKIHYEIIDDEPANSLDGWTNGLSRVLVQVNIYARSYQTCIEVERLLITRFATPPAQFSITIKRKGLTDFELDTKLHRRIIEISCGHHDFLN